MKISTETKILAGISITTIIILLFGVFFLSKSSENTVDSKLLVAANSYVRGNKNAKVTIVEFADFQCPACGYAHPAVKEIQKIYKDKIAYIYRHYPLPMHKNAFSASEAAEAAGEQGKFWEMYDLLYEKQSEWSDLEDPLPTFISYATQLKLNTDKFMKAVGTHKYKNKIMQDEQDGGKIGINATPTFFVNGVMLGEGAPSLDDFKSKIDEELSK